MATQAFIFENGAISPGEQWANTVNIARHKERMGRNEIARLGIALSGAVAVIDGVEMNINDFIQAAQPPLNAIEASELTKGYMQGNVLLFNTVGNHMQVEETRL